MVTTLWLRSVACCLSLSFPLLLLSLSLSLSLCLSLSLSLSLSLPLSFFSLSQVWLAKHNDDSTPIDSVIGINCLTKIQCAPPSLCILSLTPSFPSCLALCSLSRPLSPSLPVFLFQDQLPHQDPVRALSSQPLFLDYPHTLFKSDDELNCLEPLVSDRRTPAAAPLLLVL